MKTVDARDVEVLTEWCRNKPEEAAIDIITLQQAAHELRGEMRKQLEGALVLLERDLDDQERAVEMGRVRWMLSVFEDPDA